MRNTIKNYIMSFRYTGARYPVNTAELSLLVFLHVLFAILIVMVIAFIITIPFVGFGLLGVAILIILLKGVTIWLNRA